jgi:hypothetical protein
VIVVVAAVRLSQLVHRHIDALSLVGECFRSMTLIG